MQFICIVNIIRLLLINICVTELTNMTLDYQ